MIQRVQSIYMLLLVITNLFVIISIDSNPEMSLPESYFGFFRPYVNDYFFSEIISVLLIINIFCTKDQIFKSIFLEL